MITGDHIITGSAIAKELGIIDDESQAMEGSYINDYSDKDFREKVKEISVFARVSPEHKVRIVDSIKANGDIAAMTGDGVNDAPALKKSRYWDCHGYHWYRCIERSSRYDSHR